MMLRSSLVLTSLVVFVSVAFVACGDDASSSGPGASAGGSTPVEAGSEAGDDAAGTGGTSGTGGTIGTDASPDADLPEASADAPPDAPAADANDGGSTCTRTPGPADADRFVVISHPYDASAGKSNQYEVLKLTTAGVLSSTGNTFDMGRSFMGDMVFTPDGEIGVVAQEDGSLGVFKLDAAGTPEVIEATFQGGFYAARLVMHPSGDRVYVLDSQWATNGGGVYEVRINCDGTVVDEGRLIEAQLPYAMVLLPGVAGNAVIAAKNLLSSPAGDDAQLLSLEPQPNRIAGVDVFADDEQIIDSAAVMPDGKYVLLGDNAAYSGLDNRVAVVEVGANTLTFRQMLTPILDPIAIVASPFGDTALVVSGFGDGIFVLDYNAGNASSPFSVRGELPYEGQNPQLPGRAVMIGRGQLQGRVLVAENTAVRMVQFTSQGLGVTDIGPWSTGSGMESITGVVGVQP